MKYLLILLLLPTVLFSATISWDANGESDLAGYKIYYGESAGSYTELLDVGNVTSYQIQLTPAINYYFAVTAYDYSGNESTFSEEVSFVEPGFPQEPLGPPLPVIDWRDTPKDTNVVRIDTLKANAADLPIKLTLSRMSNMVLDSLQIDFNDKFWGVVGTVYFAKTSSGWVTTTRTIKGLKSGSVYAINARFKEAGKPWDNEAWPVVIPKRLKVEAYAGAVLINEIINIELRVQLK